MAVGVAGAINSAGAGAGAGAGATGATGAGTGTGGTGACACAGAATPVRLTGTRYHLSTDGALLYVCTCYILLVQSVICQLAVLLCKCLDRNNETTTRSAAKSKLRLLCVSSSICRSAVDIDPWVMRVQSIRRTMLQCAGGHDSKVYIYIYTRYSIKVPRIYFFRLADVFFRDCQIRPL